jgi:hypothetical protein
MSIVMVIAASPDGGVPPVSPLVVGGSLCGGVVAGSVAGGVVAGSVPGAVAGAVVSAAPPPSSSSPQAAATATSDRPAAKAKSRFVRLMLLTSSPPHRMNGRE